MILFSLLRVNRGLSIHIGSRKIPGVNTIKMNWRRYIGHGNEKGNELEEPLSEVGITHHRCGKRAY